MVFSKSAFRLARFMLWLVFACIAVSSRGTETQTLFPQTIRVLGLEGKPINPFTPGPAKGLVFIFVSIECPISNSYIPEYVRLERAFSSRGFEFKLIYPNADESAEAIQKHLKEFKCPLTALRDPHHELVKTAGVGVTPEVAVFSPGRGVVYRGRIDDRYIELGKARPKATTHDLQDALTSILNGIDPKPRTTRAIGCYIAQNDEQKARE